MEKIQQLAKLNSRREQIIDNIFKYGIESEKLSRRLGLIRDLEDNANQELIAIEYAVNSLIDDQMIQTKIHKVHDFVINKPMRYILEVNILGFNSPIFKILSDLDIALYLEIKNTADQLIFNSRVKEIAIDFLNESNVLSQRFEVFSEQNNAILDYIEDDSIESRLKRQGILMNR